MPGDSLATTIISSKQLKSGLVQLTITDALELAPAVSLLILTKVALAVLCVPLDHKVAVLPVYVNALKT